MVLTLSSLRAIEAIERSCSALSLLGSLFIIITFCTSRAFHKPINRLVFYASFGNMMTNVGTLMARAYSPRPSSAGCQFQAFVIQTFMPADAFWTLAMAVNVYLTFYFKFDGRKLRRMEWPYLLACYGLPLIPATTYLIWRDSQGQQVYGNATLWCWIAPEFGILRIATFYGPVWVIILLTFFVYVRAGRTVYEKRRQLKDLVYTDSESSSPWNGIKPTKTTEVEITHEAVDDRQQESHFSREHLRPSRALPDGSQERTYTITISADPDPFHASSIDDRFSSPSRPPKTHFRTPIPFSSKRSRSIESDARPSHLRPVTSSGCSLPRNACAPAALARPRNYDTNNAAWAYTKCAILFFTALLITWIPSSANRVFSFVHAKRSFAPLEFMSAFVLPLQGFWNAVIYVSTSWRACQAFFASDGDWKGGNRPGWGGLMVGQMRTDEGGPVYRQADLGHLDQGQDDVHLSQLRSSKFAQKNVETESMTELATAARREQSEDGRIV